MTRYDWNYLTPLQQLKQIDHAAWGGPKQIDCHPCTVCQSFVGEGHDADCWLGWFRTFIVPPHLYH